LLTTILITGCSALRDGQIGLPTDQQRPTSTATSLPQPTSTQATVPSAHTTVIPTQALTPIATIEPTPTLAPLSREQRLDIFQQVWETVRDNYLYEDFNGLDWNAVRAELQPKVEAAATPEAFYTIMREMIARLVMITRASSRRKRLRHRWPKHVVNYSTVGLVSVYVPSRKVD